MHILVINSGSSSIKFSVFETGAGEPVSLFEGEVRGIGGGKPEFEFRDAAGKDLSKSNSAVEAGSSLEAIRVVVGAVTGSGMPGVDAVGYRVVHPGAKLDRHVRITDEVMLDLEEAVLFAPLHDPSAIELIREMMAKMPDVPHYACFDTVFHETMPDAATAYAIPMEYRERGVRRYGFHGLSCESIVRQLHTAGISLPKRMVIAHLGSGCSVTVLVAGRSVDTTMGLTPTGGVVMGTRPGDLDPGLVLYLLRQMEGDRKAAFGAVEKMLNHDAGMVALSGLPNDMRGVREAAENGNARAKLALEIFTRSVKKAVGGFLALMGGLDAVVFAGGIGEHDARSRAEILGGLEELGILVNGTLNVAKESGVRQISASESKTMILVVPTKEDLMIAVHVYRMVQAGQ
ncbi:MAG TPA: acetate/propionate family kinase [Edaphobacter sp.]|nr:acetate/propionate family kinase [Edaphobacter sp.]